MVMDIAQVCLRLATVKGHSKMGSFALLGGGLGDHHFPHTVQHISFTSSCPG